MTSVTHWKAKRCFQGPRFCCALLAWLLSMPVMAVQPINVVTVAMDQVSWKSKSDRFICKLELDLEKNGQVAFIHAAGSPGKFHYLSKYQSVEAVRLASITAPWLPSAQSEWVELAQDQRSFQLSVEQTASLINAMDSGLWTSLRAGNTEIIIPTIHWQAVRERYQQCETELSPMSVAQARDNVLRYARGQTGLTIGQQEFLDRLSRYARFDSRISKILIDGHTDDLGGRIANLQLARQRANDVAAALVSAGVKDSLLEVRAHGDRYPVSDNKTPEGRDQNRRVTIRVLRKDGQDKS